MKELPIVDVANAQASLGDLERGLKIFDILPSAIAEALVYSNHPDDLVSALDAVLSREFANLQATLNCVSGTLKSLSFAKCFDLFTIRRAHDAFSRAQTALALAHGAIDWTLLRLDTVRNQDLADSTGVLAQSDDPDSATVVTLYKALAHSNIALASASSSLTLLDQASARGVLLVPSHPLAGKMIGVVLSCARSVLTRVAPVWPEAKSNGISPDILDAIETAVTEGHIDRVKDGLNTVLQFLKTSDVIFGKAAQDFLAELNRAPSVEDRLAFIRARTNKVARDKFGDAFAANHRRFLTQRGAERAYLAHIQAAHRNNRPDAIYCVIGIICWLSIAGVFIYQSISYDPVNGEKTPL